MMKLLSPAGEFESLKQAVYNGADEVYLGVKDFNARNIDGFNLQTLKQAVEFAHIFDVKVHLTVNILFSDEELQSALDLIVDAYNIGVDAFIVQDIGLICLLNKHYPQIEVHASTQMGIHNLEGVKQLEKLGVKRVVLSRETSLEEIKRIRQNSKVEIEYFVQGALCVSFSGNCYISSYLENASGNRGKCRQLCRLPYQMMYGNKQIANGFLLSAKDFCMLNRLTDLQSAGVDAIKIEGRARRPFYVGIATKYYRSALDGVAIKDRQDLNLAFNREFTEGYFNGNGNIISKIQGHNGVNIGKVIKVNNGKKFNEVFVSTNYQLTPKSTLKIFREGKEYGVISPYDVKSGKNQIIFTTTSKLKAGDTVNVIMDAGKEEQQLNITYKKQIDIQITAKVNKPLTATLNIKGNQIKVDDIVLPQSKNQALSLTDFKTSFDKNEYFKFNITLKTDGVFATKAQLNAFRRKCINQILQTITQPRELKKITLTTKKDVNLLKNYKIIEDLQQISTSKQQILIYSPQIYDKQEIQTFTKQCLKNNKTPYLNLPIFATNQDIQLLKDILVDKSLGVVANNLYALSFNNRCIIGGGLNVYNSVSAQYLQSPCLIAENNLLGDTIKMPYMTLKHCPLKQFLNADCANCPYKQGYKYKMQSGKVLNLRRTKISSCTFYLTD